MTKQRRWLKSVIAASQDTQVALPFQRQNRRCPGAFKSAPLKAPAPQVRAAG